MGRGARDVSWLATLPAGILTVVWLIGPGLAGTYAMGLRGVAAWGCSPVLSVAAVSVSAVLAGWLGVSWSPAVPLVAALVFALIALAVRLVVHRLGRGPEPPRPDGISLVVAALVGLVGAATIGIVTTLQAVRGPGVLSQTYDAVFHYNAVAQILATGNASSLAVGTLTSVGAETAFYPAAWHDLVSLVALSAGAPVPVATNVTALGVAAVVWPLACLVLVRQIAGRSAVAVLAAPVVAVGFIAFPWTLMTFGVLWPNLLGYALLPIGLAAVITLAGYAKDTAISRGHALVVAAVSVAVLGLAHPNTVFALAALAAFPVLLSAGRTSRALAAARRWLSAAGVLTATVAAFAIALYVVVASPLLATVRSFDWPAYQSPPQAVGEVLLNATNLKDAAWAISTVLVLGAVAAARHPSTRWLLAAHLVSTMLFVLASSLETELAAALTGAWYNDSHRLAAMVPTTGVPLTVLGLLSIGSWAAGSLHTGAPGRAVRSPGALSGVALALLIVASSGMYVRDHAAFLSSFYAPPGSTPLLKPEQRAFLDRVADIVPPGSVVAQNPWTGSALLYALTGREVLFPHMSGSWTAEQQLLAEHLDDAATDPRVCPVAERLGVEYALTGPVRFWPWDPRTGDYPGIEGLAGEPGFQLVARGGGGYRLYRITACEPDAMRGGPVDDATAFGATG